MSSSEEVLSFLHKAGYSPLGSDTARAIFAKINLPIDLSLMSSYEDSYAEMIDIDVWNMLSGTISTKAQELLKGESFYLYINAHPKSFMLELGINEVTHIIFSLDFYWPYAIFSKDLLEYLIEDHSGPIVANGRFRALVQFAAHPEHQQS